MRSGKSDQDRRRKRRRRRIQAIIIYAGIAIGLAWFFESQATTTIIFVRHAEKELNSGDDPGLSDAGRWCRSVPVAGGKVDGSPAVRGNRAGGAVQIPGWWLTATRSH